MAPSGIFSSASKAVSQSLPPEFDLNYYRRRYPDLAAVKASELEQHYRSQGIAEGRQASPAAMREGFIKLLDDCASILEIGPFANPAIRGNRVKYFDVLSTDALKKKAVGHNLDPKKCPDIDYVSPTGDLSVITEQFDAVFSSHAIEHQPDLIQHLQNVAGLLKPGGKYFMAVPDKRYCFDHFIKESSIADVLDSHIRKIRFHDPVHVIEHLGLTTHNDPLQHWIGEHGAPRYKATATALRGALDAFFSNQDSYIDTHAWQFTPESFRDIAQSLFALGSSPLQVARIYGTISKSNEFYVVLEKTDQPIKPLKQPLPDGFDAALYLQANPDVAAAGMKAEAHYLQFGRAEKRKLRP